MKKYKVLFVLFLMGVLLPACAPEKPGAKESAKELKDLSEKVTSLSLSTPNIGAYKVTEYLVTMPLTDLSKENCKYKTTEKTTITLSSETQIQESYERTTEGYSSNVYSCPSKSSSFIQKETKLWSVSDYIKQKKDEIKKSLELDTLTDHDWIEAIEVISTSTVTENTLTYLKAKYRITDKSARVYYLEQLVSQSSLFVGVKEYIRTQASDDAVVTYRIVTDFSLP